MEEVVDTFSIKNRGTSTILTSLTLEPTQENKSTFDKSARLECLKCDKMFDFPNEKDDYLGHLFLQHRLVIADVEDIANIIEYLLYWNREFKEREFEHYCTTMLLDQLPDGTSSKNEKYYLLSDILPKDYELRENLRKKRLEEVLAQHQFERTDRTYERECLHCRDVIKGLRSDYLEHLFNKHFIQLGKPENLVFIDELIDTVQEKLEKLICLYCEKIFKDRSTLKEHMRKKQHKRINPEIRFYDKFFLINYKTENPKKLNIQTLKHSGRRFETEDLNNINSDDDESWSDWNDEKQKLTCLYCTEKNTDFSVLKFHILKEHQIDFDKEIENLNFYQKIKVVNYIRRQVHLLRCVACNERLKSYQELLKHMNDFEHFGIGTKKQWDKPEYFFPTFEDDGLLYLLDCSEENDESAGVSIYSEEINENAKINICAENLSLENFKL